MPSTIYVPDYTARVKLNVGSKHCCAFQRLHVPIWKFITISRGHSVALIYKLTNYNIVLGCRALISSQITCVQPSFPMVARGRDESLKKMSDFVRPFPIVQSVLLSYDCKALQGVLAWFSVAIHPDHNGIVLNF